MAKRKAQPEPKPLTDDEAMVAKMVELMAKAKAQAQERAKARAAARAQFSYGKLKQLQPPPATSAKLHKLQWLRDQAQISASCIQSIRQWHNETICNREQIESDHEQVDARAAKTGDPIDSKAIRAGIESDLMKIPYHVAEQRQRLQVIDNVAASLLPSVRLPGIGAGLSDIQNANVPQILAELDAIRAAVRLAIADHTDATPQTDGPNFPNPSREVYPAQVAKMLGYKAKSLLRNNKIRCCPARKRGGRLFIFCLDDIRKLNPKVADSLAPNQSPKATIGRDRTT